MEDQVNHLVQKAWSRYQTTPSNQRLLIAISGIPGSGKTSLAQTINSRLNTALISHQQDDDSSVTTASYIPMDGYHLSRAQLSSLPDPTTARARRGAAFTFDAESLYSLVLQLRSPITSSTSTIYAPSFSHALKDPIADDIAIPPSSRIVVLEGNYLSLGRGRWKEIAGMMDELWFVEVDEDTAARRLVRRHLDSGIEVDEEAAWRRVRGNDLLNGREIVERRVGVHEVVVSREDEGWKPRGGQEDTRN